MQLDVSRAMRSPDEKFPFIHHERIAPQEIYGEEVTFDEPVVLEGRFCMSGSELTLDGTLTATAHSRCCNCLGPATVPINVPFHETFVRLDHEVEPEDDDPDRLSFTGSKVELGHLAMTLAVLELPIRILCRPDCEGYKQMAPQYTGRVAEEASANPFSVLKQLIKNDQDDQEV